MTYTEQEIQKRGEIFIKEIRLFGMTFRFYVYKDFCGNYTNLILYKYNFGAKTYEEINVYFIDVLTGENLDKEIKKDLKEYMMRPLTKKYIARYLRCSLLLIQHKIKNWG